MNIICKLYFHSLLSCNFLGPLMMRANRQVVRAITNQESERERDEMPQKQFKLQKQTSMHRGNAYFRRQIRKKEPTLLTPPILSQSEKSELCIKPYSFWTNHNPRWQNAEDRISPVTLTSTESALLHLHNGVSYFLKFIYSYFGKIFYVMHLKSKIVCMDSKDSDPDKVWVDIFQKLCSSKIKR